MSWHLFIGSYAVVVLAIGSIFIYLENKMATKEEFAALVTDITTFTGRVDNVLSDLQAKIDAGDQISSADIQSARDTIAAELAKVNAADPDTTNNGTEPTA